ncbi:hypothetical protein JTB14_037495 [Gonioctena quinquepunctata]|nr:hypothetical protein JTB14_037495 [Gonioctena quinquepunctata]
MERVLLYSGLMFYIYILPTKGSLLPLNKVKCSYNVIDNPYHSKLMPLTPTSSDLMLGLSARHFPTSKFSWSLLLVQTPTEIIDDYRKKKQTNSCAEYFLKEAWYGSQCFNLDNKPIHCELDGIMATLPTDPRQPPDGHEFPDFIEHHNDTLKHNFFKQTEPINFSTEPAEQPERKSPEVCTNLSNLILRQTVSASNTDLRHTMYDSIEDLQNDSIPAPSPLHTRSQSLIDMSALNKQKNAKWNQLVEQRRKGLSKLKGLVIPEATETDVIPCVSVPEIKSQNTLLFPPVPKIDSTYNIHETVPKNDTNSVKSSIAILPWSSNSTSNLPKYSPAFKRKSLHVYPTSISKDESSECTTNLEFPKYCDKTSSRVNKLNEDDLNPPKSLESISSPTRSDCSFDYINSSRKFNRDGTESFQKSNMNKVEDESDNDSAVSSSQSSYNSRYSPPLSPTRSCELNNYSKREDEEKNAQNRLLKPSSVEAINRKNILASAKCRSGKDLKIGSPVIRRKQKIAERTDGDGVKDEKIAETQVVETVEIVETENLDWQSDSPVADEKTEVEEEIITPKETFKPKTVERTLSEAINIVNDTPVKPLPRSFSLSNSSPSIPTLTKTLEQTRESRMSRNFYSGNRKSAPINVKALMENFENFGSSPPPLPQNVPSFKPPKPTRNIKADIVKKEIEISPKVINELAVEKSKKSEVSPARIVKPRRLSLEKNAKPVEKNEEVKQTTIVLKSEFVGSSLGITLAGGTDENKEITVHRIRYGSIAYHDGRLKRGDRIISVNGHPTKGLTHSEAVELLKEPVTEFSIVIEEGNEVPLTPISSTLQKRSSSMSVLTDIRSPSVEVIQRKANQTISIIKDGSGLGFSIEGGKDSPQGDVPLVVKKIFTGGPADKSGQLKVGDEIIQINDVKFTNLSRIEAWNSMKKIPEGQVNIHIYR